MGNGVHFDRLETRLPEARERALFRDLRALLQAVRNRTPALRRQLSGIPTDALRDRAALARVPVLRKSDLADLQRKHPPFGGLTPTGSNGMLRLLVSPGPIFEPQAHGADWWGAGRAVFAAGIRKRDIAINCFSYHLTPGGYILESGLHAVGCAVIPGGVGNTEAQVEAIHHFRPRAYCGTPDFLKILLDASAELKRDASSLRCALVSGAALPPSLRSELEARGVSVRQAYATAELGVVAYETSDARGDLAAGMVANERLIVEIVRPGTGDPVAPGEVGEIVVTRLNAQYPLLRLATGDLSAFLPGASPCGRTNVRLRGWMGRADQTTKVKGMFVHPSQVAEVGRRHPELGRLRLVVTRIDEQDEMTLNAECATGSPDFATIVAGTLQSVTKLRGAVRLAPIGELPNDGKVIADERTSNPVQ